MLQPAHRAEKLLLFCVLIKTFAASIAFICLGDGVAFSNPLLNVRCEIRVPVWAIHVSHADHFRSALNQFLISVFVTNV